jgi:hypothetical protein
MTDNSVKDQNQDTKANAKRGLKGGKQNQRKAQHTNSNTSLNSDAAVPMLPFGVSSNFDLFKRKVSIACQEKYKNLGHLIYDEAYYTPTAVDTALYNLTNDPYEIEKGRLREAHKRRDKEIDDMRIDRTSMFAYLISKLSKESYDEVQGHKDWGTIESSRDPLQLWLAIKSTHQILTTSKVAGIIKKTAREEYSACKQGSFEHILDYKRRFDSKLDALRVSGNTLPTDEDVALDFMYGLDNSRYTEFKVEIVNDLQKGTQLDVGDLNKMYVLASRRVVVKANKDGGGATFATIDTPVKKKGNPTNTKLENEKSGVETEQDEKALAKLAKMKCFNCGGKGHPTKACPHKEKQVQGEMCGMTLQLCCKTAEAKLHKDYEVCLDSGSQVNIVNSRLLTNLRTSSKRFQSMNGSTTTNRVGYLSGFFDCQVCDTCPTSILSQADVEDLYPVTYIQGESYTVHMDDRDLLFVCKDKMYVADFSDWLVTDDQRKEELHTGLSLLTVAEKESMYSSKDVRCALEAGEFLRAMGYPTQTEAISMVQSGNVINVPHSVDDVNRFYDIYGPQVAGIRGRTTKRHAKRQNVPDSAAKLQITYQDLVADVMHVAGQKFLVSISSPLELLMTYYVESQSTQELGNALQQHINTLRSRGFEPRWVLVDPHSSLVKLIDSKIRRVKEVARSVVAGLPYKLPRQHVKDLITYTVSRINLRGTSALNTPACPRVRFTGYRPNFKSELGLAFGDYVEVYDPKSHERSNDGFTERTESCIALYPIANRNGSWVFYNLRTESYV